MNLLFLLFLGISPSISAEVIKSPSISKEELELKKLEETTLDELTKYLTPNNGIETTKSQRIKRKEFRRYLNNSAPQWKTKPCLYFLKDFGKYFVTNKHFGNKILFVYIVKEIKRKDLHFFKKMIPILMAGLSPDEGKNKDIFFFAQYLLELGKIHKSNRRALIEGGSSLFFAADGSNISTIEGRRAVLSKYIEKEPLFEFFSLQQMPFLKLSSSRNDTEIFEFVTKQQPNYLPFIYQTISDKYSKISKLAERERFIEAIKSFLPCFYFVSDPQYNQYLKNLSVLLPSDIKKAIIPEILNYRSLEGIFTNRTDGKYYMGSFLPESHVPEKFYLPTAEKIKIIGEDPLNPSKENIDIEGAPLEAIYGPPGMEYSAPVGYYVALPPHGILPKALLIRFYGGNQYTEKQKAYKGYLSNFDRKLLSQGIAIAYLNLADLHLNDKFQSEMDENIFRLVLEGIKTFSLAIKNKKLNKHLEGLSEVFQYILGESFGGTVVIRFLEEHPDIVQGGASWDGATCFASVGEFVQKWIEPCSNENFKKLSKPLQLFQAFHDNKVIPIWSKEFLIRAKQAGKESLVSPFMVKVANKTADTKVYIGHFLPDYTKETDQVVRQILSFVNTTSQDQTAGSIAYNAAINKRRTDILLTYASLTNPKATFQDIFLGLARKKYEERLLQSIKRGIFEEEWGQVYLPLLIQTALENEYDVFGFRKPTRNYLATFLTGLIQSASDIPFMSLYNALKEILIREFQKIGFESEVTPQLITEILKQNLIPGEVKLKKELEGKRYDTRLVLEAFSKVFAPNDILRKGETALRLGKIKKELSNKVDEWKKNTREIARRTLFKEGKIEKGAFKKKEIQTLLCPQTLNKYFQDPTLLHNGFFELHRICNSLSSKNQEFLLYIAPYLIKKGDPYNIQAVEQINTFIPESEYPFLRICIPRVWKELDPQTSSALRTEMLNGLIKIFNQGKKARNRFMIRNKTEWSKLTAIERIEELKQLS